MRLHFHLLVEICCPPTWGGYPTWPFFFGCVQSNFVKLGHNLSSHICKIYCFFSACLTIWGYNNTWPVPQSWNLLVSTFQPPPVALTSALSPGSQLIHSALTSNFPPSVFHLSLCSCYGCYRLQSALTCESQTFVHVPSPMSLPSP